jgi:hypothetical protein
MNEAGVIFLPLIDPNDYDAFQRILNHALPDTYDEWGEVHVRQAADILGEGNEYREVQVYPVEFARYCTTRRTSPSIRLLYEFAMSKASWQHE